jgi:hypothetical protein
VSTIISLDCEANGLHGQIFAFAAALFVNGQEEDAVTARCPIDGPVDPWVAENVLPALDDLPVDIMLGWGLLQTWRDAYERWTADSPDVLVIAHVAWPIEARFLWEAHKDEPFSGPFPLIDVSSMLHAHGLNPLSVDRHLDDAGVPLPPGSPHHPLYDCRAAAYAYFDLGGAR